jgi:hypothetical protein
LEAKLQINQHHSTKFNRCLDQYMSKPEPSKQTNIALLRWDEEMLLDKVNILSSGKSGLE